MYKMANIITSLNVFVCLVGLEGKILEGISNRAQGFLLALNSENILSITQGIKYGAWNKPESFVCKTCAPVLSLWSHHG